MLRAFADERAFRREWRTPSSEKSDLRQEFHSDLPVRHSSDHSFRNPITNFAGVEAFTFIPLRIPRIVLPRGWSSGISNFRLAVAAPELLKNSRSSSSSAKKRTTPQPAPRPTRQAIDEITRLLSRAIQRRKPKISKGIRLSIRGRKCRR